MSKSQVNKLIAEVKGKRKNPSGKKRHRLSDAKIERDRFLNFVTVLETQNDIDAPTLSDAAVKLLTMEQTADAIEVFKTAVARMERKVDQLRPRQ